MPEIRGTTSGGELWALVEASPPPLPQGRDIKIIWRMTGNGRELLLSASGPGGRTAQPDWGPESHGSSNWDRPGLEWGAGFTFTAPGCWDIRASQGQLAGDVYVMVR